MNIWAKNKQTFEIRILQNQVNTLIVKNRHLWAKIDERDKEINELKAVIDNQQNRRK